MNLRSEIPSFAPKFNLVVGGLGFIGSNLVRHLLTLGERCLVIDNEYLGLEKNLSDVLENPSLEILKLDARQPNTWQLVHERIGSKEVFIWHLAANSDIATGSQTSVPDIENTLLTTVQLSEALSKLNCQGLVFASSSAVYGEINAQSGFKEHQKCLPESFYGVSKLASEHILRITLERLAIPLWIYRFANIVGSPATHGVIFDLAIKLEQDPTKLNVLGDGTQCKTYLHVNDLIDLMCRLLETAGGGVWNLGPGDTGTLVSTIAEMLAQHFAPHAVIKYADSKTGWPGDVGIARMDCSRLAQNIPVENLQSEEAIHRAIHEILDQLGMEFQCDSA